MSLVHPHASLARQVCLQASLAHRASLLLPLIIASALMPGLLLVAMAAAAEKGKVSVEKVEYKGWKNNLRLSNGEAELIVTLDVGPRIISYRLADGKNVLKNFDDQLGKTGEKEWQIRGGHRLWVGPEDLTRTYALDNGPVEYREEEVMVWFKQAPDSEYGIQKEMGIALEPAGSRVTLRHRLTNIGQEETTLAPWALTVMAPGGVEVIPLPEHHPHPGPVKNAKSAEDYASNLTMVLWPYFDFTDPRWHFGSKYISLRQDANRGPTKIGLAHQLGWVAYLNDGTLFIKRFPYEKGKHYPDHGCNFETFSNQEMEEIESLGPLVKLGAGKSVEHTENWELVGNVQDFADEAGIEKNIRPRVTER